MPTEWTSVSVTDQPTNGLTGEDSRDTCMSKNQIVEAITSILDSHEIVYLWGKVIVGVKELSPLAERQEEWVT